MNTNSQIGVIIEPGDRRFVVAPRQEKPIAQEEWFNKYEYSDFQQILKDELPEFVGFLKTFKIIESIKNMAFNNDAKNKIIRAITSFDEDFFSDLRTASTNERDTIDSFFIDNVLDADQERALTYFMNHKKISSKFLGELYSKAANITKIDNRKLKDIAEANGFKHCSPRIDDKQVRGYETF